jgi:hypothetical protein
MEGIPLFQWKESLYFNGKDPSISMERNDNDNHHHHNNNNNEDDRKNTEHPSMSM